MNKWFIAIGITIFLAGFIPMLEWIEVHFPWIPVFPAILGTTILGIIIILIGCFWSKLLLLKSKISKTRAKLKISEASEVDTALCLSIRATELTIDSKEKEVAVRFIVSNQSSEEILPAEFMGCAKLDANTVTKDLNLISLISSYRFKQYDTKIMVRFAINSEILSKLKNKAQERQEAYWVFDLDWTLRFPSGKLLPWKPTDIRFEQIPRIGNRGRRF